MGITTYKMRKTLKQVEEGASVESIDMIEALQEKAKRKKRRNQGFQKMVKKTLKNLWDEQETKKEYRDTLEKKVKFCPKCGYSTVIENHANICIRKCRQCSWQSRPWRKNTNIFSE